MSEERTVYRLGVGPISMATAKELQESEATEPIELQKARIARVLERGLTADRLSVDLPNELIGEWVPRDIIEVDRKKALGFWIDTEHAKDRALHSDGAGGAIVGDVIFMVTTKQRKALIDAVKRERFEKLHGSFKKKRG